MNTLSEQIAEDLRLRLAEGLPEEGLTLSSLAAEYKVSVTPVRRAVGALVEEGLLARAENGRVTLPGGGSTPRRMARAPQRPVTPDLEGALAAEILEGSLRGSLRFLREETTAQRFGVSRTVVRQVLSRLAGRGFLLYLPRRGWQVRVLDEADMLAYLDVREVMELRALDLAAGRLEREVLERMLAGNDPAAGTIDNDLHGYLIERADNPYIADFFERHAPFYHAIFDAAAPGARLTREMAVQHQDILRALIGEDWEAARRALVDHIRAQLPVVRRLMDSLNRDGSALG